MKISVITVCYNSKNTIENTIKSVLGQTYSNIEYIVIDGDSTDGTQNIIEKYRDRIAYYISEPDDGMYNAMNKAIKTATGDWIFILNSDDNFIDKNVVETIAQILENFKGDLLVGDIFLDHKTDPKLHNRILSNKNLNIMTAYYTALYQQAMFYNRELFEKYGYFDEKFRLSADLDWFYRFHKKLKIKYIPHVFCKFLIGGRSNNKEFAQIAIKERNILKNTYLINWQMNFYEWLKRKEKGFHWFAHKYFRSLARNEKIASFVRDGFWSTINTIMGWKINLIKD